MTSGLTGSAVRSTPSSGDPGNRSDRYGKWTYDLAGHEVSPDEVRERFGSYRERYGLL